VGIAAKNGPLGFGHRANPIEVGSTIGPITARVSHSRVDETEYRPSQIGQSGTRDSGRLFIARLTLEIVKFLVVAGDHFFAAEHAQQLG
jgi:hypothetical protein